MNKHRVIMIFIILIFTITALCYLVSLKTQTTNNTIGVVVTVGPEVEFVKAVGGDKVDVTLMVPPGADPHTYEPLPDQLNHVAKSKMYIEVGTPIEFELNYMGKMKDINPHMVVVNSSKGIDLILNTTEHENNSDPHVWISPKNAKIMVENIYQGLVNVDPNNTAHYTKNKDNYLKELDELNINIKNSLKGKKNRKIIVYHAGWTYFCKDYNLTQIPIEIGGKEPPLRKIVSVIDLAKKNNIHVIFVEPQYSSKSADLIAAEINGKVVKIDDLAENYIENLNSITKMFSSV